MRKRTLSKLDRAHDRLSKAVDQAGGALWYGEQKADDKAICWGIAAREWLELARDDLRSFLKDLGYPDEELKKAGRLRKPRRKND